MIDDGRLLASFVAAGGTMTNVEDPTTIIGGEVFELLPTRMDVVDDRLGVEIVSSGFPGCCGAVDGSSDARVVTSDVTSC